MKFYYGTSGSGSLAVSVLDSNLILESDSS